MEASAHELGARMANDGAARVILHIANHGGEMPRVNASCLITQADGIVVVIIPEGLARLRVGGVVFSALALGEAVKVNDHIRPLATGKISRKVSRRWLAPNAINFSPCLCAAYLEATNHLANAPVHWLKHLYHAMEVIGHTDCPVHLHFPSMPCLKLGNEMPAIHHRLPYLGKHYRRGFDIIIQSA
jgi:hypothetical protein